VKYIIEAHDKITDEIVDQFELSIEIGESLFKDIIDDIIHLDKSKAKYLLEGLDLSSIDLVESLQYVIVREQD